MNEMEKWFAADILSLGMAADAARRTATAGAVVSYQRVHVVTPGSIAAADAVPEAASEVRLYEIPATLGEAVAQLRALKSHAGSRRVTAYSMADIEERAAEGWGALPDVLQALVAAGLTDVAEMPADQLADLTRSMQALVAAGAPPRRITVSRRLGDRKAQTVETVRGSIRAIGRPLHVSPGSPVRIEVDWSLYGPKLAQVALTFGADHLDAVPATSDAALGRRRETVEDVERNIRAAGFAAREIRD